MENRKPNCSCKYCDKEIYRRPNQIKSGLVFCSTVCVGMHSRKNEKSCPICGKIIFGKSKTCSRTCSNKNRYGIKYDRTNKNNNASKSKILRENLSKIRGGVCEECGNENYNILQVHHILERYNGGTNDESNLELLCPNCHYTKHLGYSKYGE